MHEILRLRWRSAFSFIFREQGWQRKVFIGGALIALIPPIGWLMALGYRKDVAFRMIDGEEEQLPPWASWREHLLNGVRAASVIIAYYLPFLVAYWTLAIKDPHDALTHLPLIALFVLGIPLFLPVFLPVLPVLYAKQFAWISFTSQESVVLSVLFVATVFILPAAFLQVSLHRSFAAALRVGSVLRLIRRNFLPYIEAWVISVIATAIAFAALPLAPWGIFCSYLVIGHAFNNALAVSPDPEYSGAYTNARKLVPVKP